MIIKKCLVSNLVTLKYFLSNFHLWVLLGALLVVPPSYAGTASKLFNDLKQRVYQIRVIDVASGNKASIGSGFQVTKDGHVATNFHVVASYVHEPDKYKLEAVNYNNDTDEVELLGIDVIHDLAIVKLKTMREDFFQLNLGDLSKGERIYSMGNPHDLAMTIIEGNYNGLIKTSRYQKILFSGSLNAGMSGGPAFDENGHIIGVNVAKGGEQLSFLVPANKLNHLLNRILEQGPIDDFEKHIESSLTHDQDNFYGNLLSEKWDDVPFMELILPGTISESLKCWGHTVDEKDILYNGVHQHCQSQDEIYLSRDLYTGSLTYDYEWMDAEDLNRFQFYSLIQSRYEHASLGNAGDEEDVTNFQCNSSFTEISKHSWRISSCLRKYKKYQGLYDTVILLSSVDENNKGIVLKVGAAGISKHNATRLIQKFIGAIQWPN
jgi:hypothetical protein